jgi:hypothetical protein
MIDMLIHGSAPATSPSARARVVLLASIAALVVTTFEVNAAPVARTSTPTGSQVASADGADLSARKRMRRGRGNAAGLAMMGMMVGTIGGVIAAQQRRDYYQRSYAAPYYGGYPQGHSYGHSYGHYQQPYGGHRQRHYGGNPNTQWYTAREQRLNMESGAINYGPPRIGW